MTHENLPPRPWMTEDMILTQQTARKFCDAEITPHIERWNKQGRVDRDLWIKAGKLGLIGAAIPTELGGAGCAPAHDMVILLEQARTGDLGWGLGIHNIVITYLLDHGTPAQKERWLPKLASGEMVAALAMTEPSAGSDLRNIRTTAIGEGDHYRLNGSKIFITNGQTADLICVAAKTDRNAGSKAISLILVEAAKAPGFRRGRNLDKIGMKSQDTSELFFDDVVVPTENLLGGEEGRGLYQLMDQLPWERLLIGVRALGLSEYAFDQTLRYVRERQAFGQRIVDFQNTQFKLAEVKTKIEVMRGFLDSCIMQHMNGGIDVTTAAMIKWWSTETLVQIVDDCVQLHGGYGYMLEYPIARLYADVRAQRIYGGTTEIMKMLIARSFTGQQSGNMASKA